MTFILYDLLFYFFFFSQVIPSSNNLAANSLSKDVRNRNIRKVETNARVAFVIWIMEFCANICIIIVWALVYGKTSFGTLTVNMIWYYLILPHTFLMNTSHNKELIVDNGWKTTIRNALSFPFSCKSDNTIEDIQPNENLDTSKQDGSVRIATITGSKVSCEDRVRSKYGCTY